MRPPAPPRRPQAPHPPTTGGAQRVRIGPLATLEPDDPGAAGESVESSVAQAPRVDGEPGPAGEEPSRGLERRADRALGAATQPIPQAGSGSLDALQERLAERRRAQRRTGWFRIGVAALGVALVAALAWLVLASPVLALRTEAVQVEIAEGSDAGLVDLTQVTAIAGANSGVPLARLDTGGIAEELRALPAVLDASVERSWPHGVVVEVTPRAPVVLADTGGEMVDLVGADGVVVASVPADQAPGGLPRLAIDMSGPEAAGAVEAVLGVLAALPAPLAAQIAEAGATGPQAISFTLTDGAGVTWGDAQETELKARVLEVLLSTGSQHYDVSTPRTPITR